MEYQRQLPGGPTSIQPSSGPMLIPPKKKNTMLTIFMIFLIIGLVSPLIVATVLYFKTKSVYPGASETQLISMIGSTININMTGLQTGRYNINNKLINQNLFIKPWYANDNNPNIIGTYNSNINSSFCNIILKLNKNKTFYIATIYNKTILTQTSNNMDLSDGKNVKINNIIIKPLNKPSNKKYIIIDDISDLSSATIPTDIEDNELVEWITDIVLNNPELLSLTITFNKINISNMDENQLKTKMIDFYTSKISNIRKNIKPYIVQIIIDPTTIIKIPLPSPSTKN